MTASAGLGRASIRLMKVTSLVARVAHDTAIGGFDGVALAFEHLGKIVIGGEQRSGHLARVIVAARGQQDVALTARSRAGDSGTGDAQTRPADSLARWE
jgi:hypothetical protein